MVSNLIKFLVYGVAALLAIGGAGYYVQILLSNPALILPVVIGIAYVGIFGVIAWYLLERPTN